MMTPDRVPLKRLARLNPETLTDSTDPSFSFDYIDIGSTSRGELAKAPERLTFGESPSRARRVLQAGDSILSTVRTYLRAAWTVPADVHDLVASTGFVCLRPRDGVDARYLGWLVQSDDVVEEVVARSVGVSYPAISPEEVGRIKVLCPPRAQQAAIGRYLDRETTRIDGLVTAKRRMVELLQEREYSDLSHVVVPRGRHFGHLRYFATIQGGLTVDASRDPGAEAVTRPYLRVANVQAGRLDLDEVSEITVPRPIARRSTLRNNDVLMTEGGDIDKLGRGTVWEGALDDCLHQNHIFAVRPDPLRLDSRYLALLTQSAHARAYFEGAGVQSTNLASISSSKILDFPIPVMPLAAQREIVAEWNRRSAPIREMRRALREQTASLKEHRVAIINSAVTGHLDISEAT